VRVLAAWACGLFAALSVHAAPLRWAAQNDILTLDPHSQNHTTSLTIAAQVYEGLVRRAENNQPEPSLATRWTFISPTQVRFELRRGVKFHDGSPFTADDVIFSFARIREPQGAMQAYVSGIREIRRVGDHTIDLMLEAPAPLLLQNLVTFCIMSRTWALKNNAVHVEDFKAKEENHASRNANGTGPYRLVSWTPDQAVQMVINKDWWDSHKGNVTELTYLPIKSAPTRVAALLSGDVDLVTDVPPQDYQRLHGMKADARLKLMEGAEVRTLFFAMDQGSDELRESSVKGRNPFKDRRVREAMNLALDREAIQRSIMRGLSVPAALMVPPGVTGHDAALDTPLKPDPDKARKLLAQAGYPQGFELSLRCPNNRYVNDEQICQAAVAMWARIGVRVRLNAQPMSLHIQALERYESSFYLIGIAMPTYDAHQGLQAWGHSRDARGNGGQNFNHLADPALDTLVERIQFEPDTTARNALIREALLRVRDESFFIPVHHQIRPWAMKPGVRTLHRSNDTFEARFTSIL
jgi:peptide/nickel transport system substrate-binding protein